MAKRLEYKVERPPDHCACETLELLLNDRAAEGWELHSDHEVVEQHTNGSYTTRLRLIFQRKVHA